MNRLALWLLCGFFIFQYTSIVSAKEALSGTGLSGRINFGLGYGAATNEFDRKYNYSGFAAHLDLQAELRPLIIGVTTMGLIKANSTGGDSSAMAGLYLGYGFGKSLDLIVGPSFGFSNMVRKGVSASPNDELRSQADAAGAFLGVRTYLGRIGLSIGGYYMKSSDYDQTTKLGAVETKSNVDRDGYVSGVLISLFVSTGSAAATSESKGSSWWPWLPF